MVNLGKNNGTRYCKKCGGRVVKNGKHSNGKQRWLCRCCNSSLIHRVDYKNRLYELTVFHKWITTKMTATQAFGENIRTFYNKVRWCWDITPTVKIPDIMDVLVVDGFYVRKDVCCIVAKADGYIVGYVWCIHESIEAYMELFYKLPMPRVIVTDGFTGCISAADKVYKADINIQRCVFHVTHFIMPKLRQCKEHKAGKELLDIVCDISEVKTVIDYHKWMINFDMWRNAWDDILFQVPCNRDYTSANEYNKENKTRKKILTARKHLINALDNLNLFTYIICDNVPNTTNLVEGGINSMLRQLIRCHGGLSIDKQKKVIEWHLWNKSINPDLREFL
jgi:transposase-like protein